MLSETEYDKRAAAELSALLTALDTLDTDQLEVELSSDILSLEFADGTKYVVNSHRAARQIWLAAEREAWHFDWLSADAHWLAHKTNDELWATLSRILSKKLAQPVSLRK